MNTPTPSDITQAAALNTQLAQLQQSASVVSVQIVSTNRAFYAHLAELYMWWRSAEAVPNYLATEYGKLGRKFKKSVSYGINFAPLFWLVWGDYNGLTVDKAGNYSRVLNKLHEKYQAEKQYQTDSVAKLGAYVVQSGGVDGLIGVSKPPPPDDVDDDDIDDDQDDNDPASDAGPGRQTKVKPLPRTPGLNVDEMIEQLYGSANNFYSAIPAPTTIQLNTAIPLTADGMGLVLVRKVGHRYQLVGASSDETMVRPVAMQTYLQDFTAIPTSLRTIVEAISTQCLPRKMQSFYDSLVDAAAKGMAPAGKKSVRRLMYLHASGEFLLSPIRAVSGVVTYAKPKHIGLIDTDCDIFLPTRNRRALERKLIAGRDFNLYQTSSPQVIPKLPASDLASHVLRIQHRFVPTDYMHLDFWPFYDDMPTPRGQLIANGPDAASAVWHGALSPSWSRKFAFEFVAKWIGSHGNNIKRDRQEVFRLEFRQFSLTTRFFYVDKQFQSDVTVDFDAATTTANPIDVHVLTKDFAIAMHAVAELDVCTAIDVAVDGDGIAIRFGTTAADYRLCIPTCTVDRVRSAKHFKQYEPAPVLTDAFENYYDPTESEVGEEV